MREDDKHKNRFFWRMLSIQIQKLGISTKYGLETWNQCGKRVENKRRKFWGLNLTFVYVTGKKLIEKGYEKQITKVGTK